MIFSNLIKYIERLCKNNKIIENHKLLFNKHPLICTFEYGLHSSCHCCFYMSLKISSMKKTILKITKIPNRFTYTLLVTEVYQIQMSL